MGKWHKPWQVAWTIENIKRDYTIEQLYQFELDKGWTNASEKQNFLKWKRVISTLGWVTPNKFYMLKSGVN